MRILYLNDYEIKSGGFADVLIDKSNNRALKLFKSYRHPALDGTVREDLSEEITNLFRKKVFQTEVEAYSLVQTSEILKKHTPEFYGIVKFDKVYNNDRDQSQHYLKDCCFEMEFIEGSCQKLNDFICDTELLLRLESLLNFSISEIQAEFLNLGIEYTLDSSAIFNSHTFAIIDFAIRDPFEFGPIIGMDNWL